jgi:hypothetical protein
MRRKQVLALCVVFGGLVLASRLPLAPGQLFSHDDVNFAYAIGDFDPRLSQPQPPGYPLFVLESRILYWLRFRRPESNLLALAMLSSIASVVALAWFGSQMFGDRVFGGDAGLCAAWLLVFHHSFWYAGLTSAVRPHLAVVSVVVAATCWQAWSGERRGLYRSAAALGLGAGIRPELGPLLLPLWVTSALRARATWLDRAKALGLLTASVLVWLAPTVQQSGGPRSYLQICRDYLADQAVLTSGLFGAEGARWQTTVTWLFVWTLSGVLACVPAAVLAWRPSGGFGLTWSQAAFLWLWGAPSFVFAALVHIADPGQGLGILPVVCLLGGWWISRAASRVDGWLARTHAVVLLLIPALFLNALVFFRPGWYYRGPAAEGWRKTAHRIWEDVHSGMAFSSLHHIRGIAWVDDAALEELRRLKREWPGDTVVVWERGRTSSRKAGYYFQDLRVIVLSPKTIRTTATLAARYMRGPRVERLLQGPAPLVVPVPAGARLVWLVDPKTPFFADLKQSFPLQDADPLYYTDLPSGGAEQQVGSYLFTW